MTPKQLAFCAISVFLIWASMVVRMWYHWLPAMWVQGYYIDMFLIVWSGIGALSVVGHKFARMYFIRVYGIEQYIKDIYPLEVADILRDHSHAQSP